MGPEIIVALVLAVALGMYVLTGGADFGGGICDLLATGPRQIAQRRAIATSIGPIWEANHVWLILAIVLTFVAFPQAFALISTALHIPLTLMLVGIVLRGTAFVFRAYDSRRDDVQRRWSVVFAVSSAFTPFLLGTVVGAIASGDLILRDGIYQEGFVAPWLAPFPLAVGALTVSIFAFLAAVYLTIDTQDAPELQEDFRRRGLAAAGAVVVTAWTSFFLAKSGAPAIWEGLWKSSWAYPFQIVVGVAGLATIAALYTRRYQAARALGAFQVALVIGGWAACQWPWVVPGSVRIADSAPANTLWVSLGVLAVGTPPLLVAYAWMMTVFRAEPE